MARISTSVLIIDRRRLRFFLNKYLEEFPFEEFNNVNECQLEKILSDLRLTQAAVILEDVVDDYGRKK